MNTVYLLTGGNVGNRAQYLHKTAEQIGLHCGAITRQSAIYETAPWGKTDQAAFLNQALELSTDLEPLALLAALQAIENAEGRQRSVQYGPRTIDIDILLFNHLVIDLPTLSIPHPQMALRRFVLQPLQEIAGNYLHPVLNISIAAMLAACTDPLPVKKFSAA